MQIKKQLQEAKLFHTRNPQEKFISNRDFVKHINPFSMKITNLEHGFVGRF